LEGLSGGAVAPGWRSLAGTLSGVEPDWAARGGERGAPPHV